LVVVGQADDAEAAFAENPLDAKATDDQRRNRFADSAAVRRSSAGSVVRGLS
jgi:hypothetical protein